MAKRLRESGLSYQRIANQIGVSKSTVQRWLMSLDDICRQRESQRKSVNARYRIDAEYSAKSKADQRRRYRNATSSVAGRIEVALATSRRQAKQLGHSPCNASVEQLLCTIADECQICGVPEAECKSRLHLDHDHQTGQFRGWLCAKCNKSLGLMNDDKTLLIRAACYLSNTNNL